MLDRPRALWRGLFPGKDREPPGRPPAQSGHWPDYIVIDDPTPGKGPLFVGFDPSLDTGTYSVPCSSAPLGFRQAVVVDGKELPCRFPERRDRIRKLLRDGYDQVDIAWHLGISPSTVHYYVKRFGLKP